jgi:aspartate racemase
MAAMRPVGIIGGMGPEATVLLMQKTLAAVPARDDADHVPLIVWQNTQVPSRIRALIDGDGEAPAPVLARMARDLQAAGAQALAMPCNTAHHYATAITSASDLPFLDMLHLTASVLAAKGARRIGMLASPATRITGVFDRDFAAAGLAPVWSADEAGMLAIIRAVKAGQTGQGKALVRQAEALMTAGADHLLVACTELSLLARDLPEAMPCTDSLDCLVGGIVDFARG